jgi:hypothetical protein
MAHMRWRPVTGLRTALLVLLVGSVVSGLLLVAALTNRNRVIAQYREGGATLDELHGVDGFVDVMLAILGSLALVTAIVWIVWQWRVAKNAATFSRFKMRLSPVWSIWGWLIPCASIVIPALVMQDLWRASDPAGAAGVVTKPRGSGLVAVWFTAFVLSGFQNWGFDSSRGDDRALDSVQTAGRLSLYTTVLLVVAGVLAIVLVAQLTERFEALRRTGPTIDPELPPTWRPPATP